MRIRGSVEVERSEMIFSEIYSILRKKPARMFHRSNGREAEDLGLMGLMRWEISLPDNLEVDGRNKMWKSWRSSEQGKTEITNGRKLDLGKNWGKFSLELSVGRLSAEIFAFVWLEFSLVVTMTGKNTFSFKFLMTLSALLRKFSLLKAINC